MVIIRNIENRGDIVSCDYYPEGKDVKGKITADKKSRELVNVEYARPYDDEVAHTYAWMARTRLLEVCDSIPLPKEDIIMWY